MITFPLSLSANWQRGNRVTTLTEKEKEWLLEPNSLTAKLKRNSHHFAVQVLSEKRFVLNDEQHRVLGSQVTDCINREVLLCCNDFPMVYAQSWLPTTDAMQNQQLLALGNKPLGEVIFQHPDLTRTEIDIALFDCQHPVQQLIGQYKDNCKALWGRRSVFSLAQSRFLVSEIFLPKAFIYQ